MYIENTPESGTTVVGATQPSQTAIKNSGEVAATTSPVNENPAAEQELNEHEELSASKQHVEPNGCLRPDSAAGGDSLNPEEKLDPGIEWGNSACPEDPQSKPEHELNTDTKTMKTTTAPTPDNNPNSDPETTAAENSESQNKTADELMEAHVGEVPKVEKKFSLAGLKSKSEEAVPKSSTKPGTITVGKPNDDAFVRTSANPEEWAAFDFIELKTEKKLYLLTPNVVEEINALNEDRAQVMIKSMKKRLIYSVTRLGDPFLWPITIMDGDNDWIDSANSCAEAAKEDWVRVVSNTNANRYDYVTSPSTTEPKWPAMTYEDAILKAFSGKVIDSMGHDVIKQLLGED